MSGKHSLQISNWPAFLEFPKARSKRRLDGFKQIVDSVYVGLVQIAELIDEPEGIHTLFLWEYPAVVERKWSSFLEWESELPVHGGLRSRRTSSSLQRVIMEASHIRIDLALLYPYNSLTWYLRCTGLSVRAYLDFDYLSWASVLEAHFLLVDYNEERILYLWTFLFCIFQ